VTQKFFYYPHKLELGKSPPWVNMERKPKRVWTLYKVQSQEDLPTLPMVPRHMDNAFLEDYVHDWNWSKGRFKYSSRGSHGEQWLLLEFEEEEPEEGKGASE